MPANLPPAYFEAEAVYRQAATPAEKVEALQAMLAVRPTSASRSSWEP